MSSRSTKRQAGTSPKGGKRRRNTKKNQANPGQVFELVLMGLGVVFAALAAFTGLSVLVWLPIAVLAAIYCGAGYARATLGKELRAFLEEPDYTVRGSRRIPLVMTPTISVVRCINEMPRWQSLLHIGILMVSSTAYALQLVNLPVYLAMNLLGSGGLAAAQIARRLKKDLPAEQYSKLWQAAVDKVIHTLAWAAFAHPSGCSPQMVEYLTEQLYPTGKEEVAA